MKKHEIFVNQPVLDLFEGVRVTKETELSFANGAVEQVLKDLKLETLARESGSNGFNTYESQSIISISLNPGDILLFNEQRGYYLPAYSVSSIEDAISDINSLEGIPRYKELG